MKLIKRRDAKSSVLIILLIAPFIPIAFWSFANRWQYPHPLPQILGIQGWRNFLATDGVAATINSVTIGLVVTALALPLSFMATWVLSHLRGWSLRILQSILFLPAFIPPFVLVMGVTTGSITIHLPPEIAVIITLTVLALPYTTYIFRSAILNYGVIWEEEGKLLGANETQLLMRIRIPMLRNAILAASLAAFLIGWSDYIVTLTVGAGQILSLPLLLGSSASGPGSDSSVAVMSIVSILIPVLLAASIRVTAKKGNRKRLH